MGINTPKLINCEVMHQRLSPRKNAFKYDVYYLGIPLSQIESNAIGETLNLNRFGLHSFYEKDHGYRDGTSLKAWLYDMFDAYKFEKPKEVFLISMPRILGYVFNPVSFWFCWNSKDELYAVVSEVNNTFGETHSYLTYLDDKDTNGDYVAKKVFHVSPFLEREGYYDFQFSLSDDSIKIHINLFDSNKEKILLTSLSGKFDDLNSMSLKRAFFRVPFATMKSIFLIHFQAVKLLLKKIKFISKPKQLDDRFTKNEKA
ncbi:MAG: DUF1365 domain-containing protein [Gammaproteobacteria bacterium]